MVPGPQPRGIALCDVSAKTDQDLMFIAGEQIVLLERLGNGVCMGFCEGVTGRFNEADVDFSAMGDFQHDAKGFPTLPPEALPTKATKKHAIPPRSTNSTGADTIAAKTRTTPSPSTTITTGAITATKPRQTGVIGTRIKPCKSDSSNLKVSSRHTLTTTKSLELLPQKNSSLRPRSSEHVGKGSTSRKKTGQALSPQPILESCTKMVPLSSSTSAIAFSETSSPPLIASQDPLSSPTGVSSPVLSSPPSSCSSSSLATSSTTSPRISPTYLYPKSILHYKDSITDLLSPPTQSSASSTVDLHCSSATITTNLLGIKSYIFPLAMEQPKQPHHQQERLMIPIYQLTTPASSCNSLFSPTISTGSPTATTTTTTTLPSTFNYSVPLASSPRFDTPVINAVFGTLLSTDVDDHLFKDTTSIEALEQEWPTSINSTDDVCCYKQDAPGHQGMELSKELKEAMIHKDEGAPKVVSSLSTKPLPPCPTSLSPEASHGGTIQEVSEKRENGAPRTSLMSDIRSRTHSVLRRAGFSIAPEAGLYNVTRQGKGEHGKDRMDPNNLVVSNLNTTGPNNSNNSNNNGNNNNGNSIVGRPRSRSIRERWLSVGRGNTNNNSNNSNSSQHIASHMIMVPAHNNPRTTTSMAVSPTSQASPTGSVTSSTGISFISVAASTCSSTTNGKAERLRPWNFLTGDHGQRQRCNSGPARHSDPIAPPQIHSKKSLDHSLLGHNSTGSMSTMGHDRLDTRDLSMIRTFFASRSSEEVKKRRHLRQVSDTTNLFSFEKGSEKSFFFGGGGSGGSIVGRGIAFRDAKNRLSMVQSLPPPPPTSPGKVALSGTRTGSGTGSKGSDAGSIGTPKPRSKSNWFGMAKRQSYPSSPSPISSMAKEDVPKSSSLSGSKVFVKGPEDYDGESEVEEVVVPKNTDAAFPNITQNDQSEKYAAAAASLLPQHQSVNDYGFIYDLEDDDAQDMSGSGSMVGEFSTSSMGHLESTSAPSSHLWGADFWAENEKRAAIRKQEAVRASELKWIQAIAQMPVDQVKKSNKFKKMVRKGVPTSVRGRVWQFLARADSLRQPGLFAELLTRPAIQPIFDVIERDVHRCYPDHVHFRDGMGGTGQQDLHAILRAYAQYNPRVGYCQGMGRLVGMMLMHMPVEDAFWLLVATLDQYMQEYYTPTLRQLRIDAQVFEQILRAHDPKLAEYLHQNEMMPLMYMTPWFLTLFTMSLPWASVLQVWDIFYFDGVKSLFRVGLAILQLCRDQLMHQCPSNEEVMDFLLHVPLEMLGPKPLFEAAFKIKLSKDSVQRMILITATSMDAEEREAEMKRLAAVKAKATTAIPASPAPVTPVVPVSEDGAQGDLAQEPSLDVSVPMDDKKDAPSDPSTPTEPNTQPALPITSNQVPALTTTERQNTMEKVVVVEVARPRSQPRSRRISCFGTLPDDDPLPTTTTATCSSPLSSSSPAVAAMVSVSTSALLPSQSPLSSPTSSSSPSTFSGLGGVFRTRKRAGTIHK